MTCLSTLGKSMSFVASSVSFTGSRDGVTGAGSAATAIVSLVVRTHLLKRTTELASVCGFGVP